MFCLIARSKHEGLGRAPIPRALTALLSKKKSLCAGYSMFEYLSYRKVIVLHSESARDISDWYFKASILAKRSNSRCTFTFFFGPQSRKEQDAIFIPALFHCTCKYKSYFLASLFAYKGLLLLFGLFLAWETRHVSIPALNDSKYIGMSVYNVFVLATIGVIVSIALDGSKYYEAPYAISSLCLIVCTTVTLLLVFVPKVIQE